jgi:hypothetical protein
LWRADATFQLLNLPSAEDPKSSVLYLPKQSAHPESCFDVLPRVEVAAQISEILSFLKKFS